MKLNNVNVHTDSTPSPKIAILMCTCNGEKYLSEQLNSIAAQTYPNWELWVSDDGSSDNTVSILEDYKSSWKDNQLIIRSGPQDGFVNNFMSLIRNNIQADFFAFSDQDDIWEKDKLQTAIKWFDTLPQETPGLYSTRSRLVDAENKEIGVSTLFTKQPSFANALVQPIGGANTMIFNVSARNLVLGINEGLNIPSHDWLMYMVVSGCGGIVTYDTKPSLRYRQHSENLMGRNCSLIGRLRRIKLLFKGRFSEWNDANVEVLSEFKANLSPKNLEIMNRFAASRKRWLLPRLIGLWQCGIYRQTILGNIGLVVAAICKKI